MKIVAIAAARLPSDAANSIQVMKACQALAQLGHNTTLLVPGKPPSSLGYDLQTFYGLQTVPEVLWLPTRFRRSFFWQAVRRARALGAELLYAWPPQSAVFGLLMGLPTLMEMHEPPSGRFGLFWYRLFLCLPGRKRLLCITRALQRVLEQRYGTLHPDQVAIGPNGVDLERFASLPGPRAARRQTGLPQFMTIGCTGHLYAGRGAELFLALAKGTPQAFFLWVGGRPEDVEEWRARSAALGLDNIRFTGFIPNKNLPLYQAAADILLMPYGRKIAGSSGGNSADICSPMKMFEYMASGRAIITSDLPVIREVLNERNAIFCPPEDIPAWQEALNRLLIDPAKCKALGRQAQQDVTQYTWLTRADRALQGFVN